MRGFQAQHHFRLGPGAVSALAPNPILFRYSAGDSIAALGGTFSRASNATYMDSSGLLVEVGANVLRDSHYIHGKRYTLLEGLRTKLYCPEPYMWSNDATVVVSTSTERPLPNGSFGSYSTAYFGGAPSEESRIALLTVLTAPEAGTYTLSVWVRGGIGGSIYLYFHNQRIRIDFAGVDVWQRVSVTATCPAGDILAWFDIMDTWGYTDHLPNVGVDMWQPQMERGPFGSSQILGEAVEASRAADSLSFPFPHPSQEISVYVRGIELGTSVTADARIWGLRAWLSFMTLNALGDAEGYRLEVFRHTVQFSRTERTPEASSIGDSIELLSTIEQGVSSMALSVNGAPGETVSMGNNPALLSGDFDTLYIGYIDGEHHGFFAFRDIIIARGTWTLEEFRSRVSP